MAAPYHKRPAFLYDDMLKLLLFGGKGGVGKTTLAAATGLHRARREPDRRVLVVSTDPAHSLSDSLDQAIGDDVTPAAGMPNLFAVEIDARRGLRDFKRQHDDAMKTIVERGTYFDNEDIDEIFELDLPGVDEMAAVFEVVDILGTGHYDLVILDTAPTGHTLRLLAMPDVLKGWIHVGDLMLEKHRYMARTFARYRPDKTDAFLKRMSSDLTRVRTVLSDAESAEFVPVTIPESMSIEETARLLDSLARFHMRVRTVVVNRVMATAAGECAFCEARRANHERRVREIQDRFRGLDVVTAPLFRGEVRGHNALAEYMESILGHALSAPDPQCHSQVGEGV